MVLAAGGGTRIGGAVPKQLLELAGRPVVGHAVAAFQRCPAVDEVLVLGPAAQLPAVESAAGPAVFGKVRAVLAGGATRTETARLAVAALGRAECNVLLHDAARPLVPGELIAAVIAALEADQAVTAAVPSTDTLLLVEGGEVRAVPDRAALWRAQTPQGFRLSVLRAAYAAAAAEPEFAGTDDCALVRRFRPDVPIRVVPGTERNLKITHPADLRLAERLLAEWPPARP